MTEADRIQCEWIAAYLAEYRAPKPTRAPVVALVPRPRRVHDLAPEWLWLRRLDHEALRTMCYCDVKAYVQSA
jgi:hypothetical protein